MLVNCKECGGQVSDKAYMCPHCGCPRSENPPYDEAKKRGQDYLFVHKDGIPFTAQKNRTSFYRIINEFGMNPLHRPHDPRKQFVTMAKKANMNEYALKKIVGHKITDITEAVYTDRDYTWLAEEIEKIKVYE